MDVTKYRHSERSHPNLAASHIELCNSLMTSDSKFSFVGGGWVMVLEAANGVGGGGRVELPDGGGTGEGEQKSKL